MVLNGRRIRTLIVDDDYPTRIAVARELESFGHELTMVSDGREAWNALKQAPVDLVITDWRMPSMNGLALCRRVRTGDFASYIYVILMTGSEDREGIVEGIDAGADDFLVKPLDPVELQARVKAAERILMLQARFEERNRRLRESNAELAQAYAVMKRDLQAGAKIQASLMPQSGTLLCGIRFESLFLPSSYVAGDVFNYFRLDEQYVGFYVIDVAGHGIPAAMLSVTLSKALSPTNHQDCILKRFMPVPDPPFYRIINPALAVKNMNQRFQVESDTMQYFTMVYGLIDTRTGQLVLSQAGHPAPIHLPHGAEASLIGEGGFPVGLFPDADYDEVEVHLKKGDRLFVYSDGVTECFNDRKEPFSVDRMKETLMRGRALPLRSQMEEMEETLRRWRGKGEFEDDMTVLALEMT